MTENNNNTTIFTAYITKYALTQGILKIEAKYTTIKGMIADVKNKYGNCYHREGDDWHKTIKSATLKANLMKEKKITSLKKQLKKMKKLSFKKEDVK